MDNQQKNALQISIKTLEGILFEGEVDAITSINEKGRFDVLPYHENFISIVKDLVVVYQKDEKPKEFPLQGGVIKVRNNTVHIFLGIQPKG